MNKKLSKLLSDYGMSVAGNSAYGKIKGYETNVKMLQFTLDNNTPLKVHISFYAPTLEKQNIEKAIRNAAIKHLTAQMTPYGVLLGFRYMTYGSMVKNLPIALDTILGIISSNGALNSEFCPVCGERIDEFNSKKCNVGGLDIFIDNNCVSRINNVIDAENQEFEAAPNNYLKGFIGALIGAMAGVVISVILYMLGFVSSLSAFVAIVLGAFLYQKLGGKPNKAMIAIVSITSLVLLLATVPVIYISAASLAASDVGLNITAIEAFEICMQDNDFSVAFYTDLAMVFLFSALAIGFEIFSLLRKVQRQKNI